jgi:prepilin-type N-terminal cleavage/methylation domain-containing protein
MKKRKGFTLIELMIVIAIIIILAAIAIPNYLRMTERARRSRVAGDFASIAVGIEAYAVDWGYYPNTGAAYSEPFGKHTDNDGATPPAPAVSAVVTGELSGDGTQNDLLGTHTTLTGETSPVEYLKLGTIFAMYNPFMPDEDYYYGTDDTGTVWVLYVEHAKDTTHAANYYLYRSDSVTDLTESDDTSFLPT